MYFCRGAEVTDCGQYLLLTPREGCDPVNRLYYVDLQNLKDGINGETQLFLIMQDCTFASGCTF